jgi:hypothetical protein
MVWFLFQVVSARCWVRTSKIPPLTHLAHQLRQLGHLGDDWVSINRGQAHPRLKAEPASPPIFETVSLPLNLIGLNK